MANFLSFAAPAAGLATSIFSGGKARGSAKRAGAVQRADYERGIGELGSGYDKAISYQQPWYDYGQNALRDFQSWGNDPNSITSDPSYKWRLGQETEALENSAASKGGLLSGNTGKALIDYAGKSASQEYANEFGRWLQKLGIGTNATNNMSTLSAGKGNALARMFAGMGDAYAGQSNAGQGLGLAAQGQMSDMLQSWAPASLGGK